jgi:hypothetical protein
MRITSKGHHVTLFSYDAPAELYCSRRYAKSARDQYKRFRTAAEALRYIVEDVPGTWLNGSVMEVDERRFDASAIRALYDSVSYPLDRQQRAA